MQTTLGKLKQLIKEMVVLEAGSLSGGLRRVRDGRPQQFKIGKVEDENRELSSFEAEEMFPGATDAWAEVVPDMFPDFPFDDPKVIKARSSWFKIGSQLRVAFSDMPQIELAYWDPDRDDWFEIEPS